MEQFKIFLANYYIWFIVLAFVFLFALIGYLLESKKKQKEIDKTASMETIKVETPVEELTMEAPETKEEVPKTTEEVKTEEVKTEEASSQTETLDATPASTSVETLEDDIPTIVEDTPAVETPAVETPVVEAPAQEAETETPAVNEEKQEEQKQAESQVESVIKEELSDESTFLG